MSTRSKTRVSHLSPPYAPDVQEALGVIMPNDRNTEPLKLFRTFVRDLPFTAAIRPLGTFMLSKRASGGAAFDLRSREIVINRVCALCRCEYEWGVHVAGYRHKAELTDEQVYSTVHGLSTDECWSAKDAAILAMVDELHLDSTLTNSTYEDLTTYFDERQILELLALTGWYHAIAYMANGLGTELEDWAPRFPDVRE